MASPQVVPAATVTTGAKPHGQQQLARDLEVERFDRIGNLGKSSTMKARLQEEVRLVAVSYTHLTLPTIYSV